MKNKIAIQGIRTSFHHLAAEKYFGKEIELIECLSFKELCNQLENGNADYAVMAIENSIAGTLLHNYALLQEYEFHIIGETFLHIQMNLLAYPGTKIEDLRYIESHPIAIRQCANYLWSLPNVELVEKPDTSASAKHIADHQLKDTGAVANTLAAATFGLDILKRNIETDTLNYTRFLVLKKENQVVENANKASICFQLAHEKGSLANVLTLLGAHGMNLTKIQSIPIIGQPYKYMFIIDFEYNDQKLYDEGMKKAEHLIKSVNVFGNYVKGDFNQKDKA